jgi:hypothetical protein
VAIVDFTNSLFTFSSFAIIVNVTEQFVSSELCTFFIHSGFDVVLGWPLQEVVCHILCPLQGSCVLCLEQVSCTTSLLPPLECLNHWSVCAWDRTLPHKLFVTFYVFQLSYFQLPTKFYVSVSPFIDQLSCTTLRVPTHILVSVPTQFGVSWRYVQGAKSNYNFSAAHQMIMSTY